MTYREMLSEASIALSISESVDLDVLGLSPEHLRDAMAEIARHLLALGARLAYGGDLRPEGFGQLLFELITRYRRDSDLADGRVGVTNFLAWPVHMSMSLSEVEEARTGLIGVAELACLNLAGEVMALNERQANARVVSAAEWRRGLTSMRHMVARASDARIVLGGAVSGYKGAIPGIAEEALASLQLKKPLYILGGFGGCARDVAEALKLVDRWVGSRSDRPLTEVMSKFKANSLNNGLSLQENEVLAETPFIDEAVKLILRGLGRLILPESPPRPNFSRG